MRPTLDPDLIPLPAIAYTCRSPSIEKFQAAALIGVFDLDEDERWWRDQYHILLEHGYKLRRRFRPDWTPSWLGTSKIPAFCEDSLLQINTVVVDAINLHDETRVSIKRVKRNNLQEIYVSKFYTDPQRRKDPRNHCVPILDSFASSDENYHLMVMPYLCELDRPPFSFIDEALDFIEQTLEGLLYLHHDGRVHRDLAGENIMMSGEQLFPNGHHPSSPRMGLILYKRAKVLRRRDVAHTDPVKYFFTDFEASLVFENPDEPPSILSFFGQDGEAPELYTGIPYNPFLLDVFTLGNVYKKRLIDEYSNLAFLKPLVSSMTNPNASDRPTSEQALEMFKQLARSKSWLARRCPLHPIGGSPRSAFDDALTLIWEEFVVRLWRSKYYIASSIAITSLAGECLVRVPADSISHIQTLLARSFAV